MISTASRFHPCLLQQSGSGGGKSIKCRALAQGQALRVAVKRRPSLTAARHDGAVEPRSGRKNGFAEVEQKNFASSLFHVGSNVRALSYSGPLPT